MICCLNPDCPNPQNKDGNKVCQSCNTPLVPLLRNRFRVIRVLSDEGGFGRTYLSEDIDKLNELCVIKQLAPKFNGTWSQKKATQLFAEEAKRLQELGEHPQIPTLIAYFEQDDCLYLVQQFINGNNLLKELQQRKTYKDWDIQSILLDLLPVIKFVHDRGVIHRDIKPENIIRRQSDGRLTLIDFGSSKQLRARVQRKVGTSIGSHGYSPIEQIRDGKAYPSSDLFSLGATCFHLLTGISPFQLWMEHGYGWVTSWQNYLRCPLSQELVYVIDKFLQKDIQNRYQSADEAIKDLTKHHNYLLPPANNTITQAIPQKKLSTAKGYGILRNCLLVLGTFFFFAVGDSGYEQLKRLQITIASSFSEPHNSTTTTTTKDAVLHQSAKLSADKVTLIKTLPGHEDSVVSVTVSPDGKIIASGGNHMIKLWNLATGKEISTLKGHSQTVNVVAITPNGKTLVSGSDDSKIKIWNLSNKKLIHTLPGHGDSVHTLAISNDGNTLVSGADDYTIKVWNLGNRQLSRTLTGHSFWVRSVAISPDGMTLASGGFDNFIKLWDMAEGKSIYTFPRNSQTVTVVAFSADGKILASGSRDRTIRLWNVATKAEIHVLLGHTNTVTTVAFSPDGKILASGSRDHTIKLWDVMTGKEIPTSMKHGNTVTSLAFSGDGKTLVSGGEDNQIKIWRLFE
jgi:WD40 repeat protein